MKISESRGPKDQVQVEAALQNDRARREVMEAGLSRLVQQLKHNAQAIQQTLMDERDSGVNMLGFGLLFLVHGWQSLSKGYRLNFFFLGLL